MHDQVKFILGRQAWFNIQKIININHHINRLKKKNHIFMSIDVGNAFDLLIIEFSEK